MIGWSPTIPGIYDSFDVPTRRVRSVPLVRLDGVLNEIVGFKCEGQLQEFYLSILTVVPGGVRPRLGYLMSVNWETGVSQVEYLIGESLPRFALSRRSNN